MKILNVEPERFSAENRRALGLLGDTHYAECRTQADLISELREEAYDVLFCKIGIMLDGRVFDNAPSLKVIATPTTGLTHIDMEEARVRGIETISLRGDVEVLRTVTSTAELAFGLVIAAARGIVRAHNHTASGGWEKGRFAGLDLRGRTLGILGFGRLGQMVAGYGLAFHMHVIASDIDESVTVGADPRIKFSSFDTVLRRADMVSIHLPYDSSTGCVLSTEKIVKVKPGVILVNTSRGEVVDEEAVVAGLRSQRISVYATDVLSGDGGWDERIPEGESPLYDYIREGHDNVIITPHMGGLGIDAINRTRSWIVFKFGYFIEHGELPSAGEWVMALDDR